MGLDTGHQGVGEVRWGDHARAVATVYAGLLDMFHHRADDHLAGVVPDGVHIHLSGVLQKPVYEHRPFSRQPALNTEAAESGQLLHGPLQLSVVVDDHHGPAAQHVGGPYKHWVADPFHDCPSRVQIGGRPPRGLEDTQVGAQVVPLFPVLGPVD